MKLIKQLLLLLALVGILSLNAHATGGMEEATTMIGEATTLFGLVKVFIVSAIGFFAGAKILKWFRK